MPFHLEHDKTILIYKNFLVNPKRFSIIVVDKCLCGCYITICVNVKFSHIVQIIMSKYAHLFCVSIMR